MQKLASFMINDKESFEDQCFERFGQPIIMCNSHPNSLYEYINLNTQNQNKLVCVQCIIKDRLNPDFLISIKEIFSANPNNIIQNWPPLQDSTIYQKLITHEQQKRFKIKSLEIINRYFEKLKVDILKTIDEHQKKILVHINSIEENRQRVIGEYSQISSKDEIKNEFLKNRDNKSELEQYLKQIISTKQAQSLYNQQNIRNSLDLLTKQLQKFQFEYIQKTLNQYLIGLKSIDLLNPNLITEQQLSIKNSEQKTANENKNDIYEIDLLESLKIIKSNYDAPNEIYFTKQKNNKFLIEKSEGGWGQVIIDEELRAEKKYQIEIEVKQNTSNYIMLGLLPIQKKNKAGWNSKLSLYLNWYGNGIDRVERGQHICGLEKDDIKQISFQICLKEKILRCLCVANNRKNINSLYDWNKVKPNKKYYFYIALLTYSQIQINQFKIIKQFEQW